MKPEKSGLEGDILHAAGAHAERARIALRGLDLASLLRGAIGRELRLRVRSGEWLQGRLGQASAQWLLLEGRTELLVVLAAVSAIEGLELPSRLPPPRPRVEQSLVALLDEIARRRLTVVLPQFSLRGRIEAVGQDFFWLREERSSRLLALGSIEWLQLSGDSG